ncbi:uncharacterized protein MELLADRAFT_93159 [Melampsora larici-populina 98AG31]|uniref:Uncharacterized protein n=1 Tax=Melampsora larici-populina (strain 98AG31 / pathotype 3-4-7) TaxID=747676 RepID=F4S4A9_MELLP|nr:uncharacterized protein MELLADRAFT_93159 [Melampsora larici-populina 98AG31]EGG00585.1 hypothetical protein MELLADRAFT_93159 [Melampsora larici-populina 98AG31]
MEDRTTTVVHFVLLNGGLQFGFWNGHMIGLAQNCLSLFFSFRPLKSFTAAPVISPEHYEGTSSTCFIGQGGAGTDQVKIELKKLKRCHIHDISRSHIQTLQPEYPDKKIKTWPRRTDEMKSLTHLIWLASLFCERLSAQGTVPLLKNLPGKATSSAANVGPDVIMVDRFTFTAPEEIADVKNKIGIRPSEETGTYSRAHHGEDDSDNPAKKIKTEPTEESQDLNFGNKEAHISTDLPTYAPAQDVVPYSFFFQSAKKIAATIDLDHNIMSLASNIQILIEKLGATSQVWEWWIYQNELLTLECFINAHTALHKDGLGECERAWTLGIVAALVKHLPSVPTEMVQRLKNSLWKHHVYLEIQAAIEFEEPLTQRFSALLMNSQHHMTNQGLEECFSRAQLFKSHDEIRARYFPAKEDGIDEFVADHLLDVNIPEEETIIKSMIRGFANHFKKLEIRSWEGTYAKAIFIYLMNHWQNRDARRSNTLLEWIQNDFNLYRDLHLPFMKIDIRSILGNPGIISKGINYNELIDISKPLREKLFQDFLTCQGRDTFSASTQSDMYKLTVIVSLIHPSLKNLVTQGIDQNPGILQRLAPVWLEMYPGLAEGFHNFFEYQYAPFRKRPTYFSGAHRLLLSRKMSQFTATKSLSKAFVKAPLNVSKFQPSLVNNLLSQVENILNTHVEHNEIPKVYLLALQVIHHMVKYSEGATEILLKKLDQDIKFRQKIYLSVDHVLQSNIFVDNIAQIDECVLVFELEPFLTLLKMIIDTGPIWGWGEVNKPAENVTMWAKELELATCTHPVITFGDLPDPRAESLLWLNK